MDLGLRQHLFATDLERGDTHVRTPVGLSMDAATTEYVDLVEAAHRQGGSTFSSLATRSSGYEVWSTKAPAQPSLARGSESCDVTTRAQPGARVQVLRNPLPAQAACLADL